MTGPELASGRDLRGRARSTAVRVRRRVPWLDEALERERIAAAGLLAGGLAYRLFFWLVPLGLVLASVLGFWVEADRTGLEDAVRDFGMGAAAARAAADAIQHDAHSRLYFLAAGLPLLAWFGVGVVRAASVAHSVAWGLPPEKLRSPLRATLVFNAITIMLVLLTGATSAVRESAPEAGLALTVALMLVNGAVVVWISTRLPSRARHWRSYLPGAAVVAVGALLIHVLVVVYLAPKLGRSSELYGSLGAATVILLWLYLVARLLVAAAFLNAALWARRGGD